MAMRSRVLQSVAVLTAGVVSACVAGEPSDGDRPLDWRVSVVGELQDPSNSLTPAPWGIAADPGSGLLYVADVKGERIVVFDSTGAFNSEYGSRGSGPGEFENVWAISMQPDGRLSVVDSRLGRISRWSADGIFLESVPLPPAYWGPALADLGDRFVTVTTEPTSDPREIRQNLMEISPGGQTLLESVSQYQTAVDLPCLRRSPAPRPLAPEPIWTTHRDTVITVRGTEYVIDLYHRGDLVRTLRRNVPPFEVTKSLAIERVEAGQLRILLERCGVDAETVVNSMDWEATVSPIERITVAGDGRLWITRIDGNKHESLVDVIAGDGSYVGTLQGIPQPIAFLAADTYVAFDPEDDSGTRLQIYRVSFEGSK